MPASFDPAFQEWLTQHGQVTAQAVNVLEFYHPAFGSKFVSDYGDPFAATTEDARAFTADPLGLVFDAAADNMTTEQRVVIRLDNANGLVMDQVRALTPAQLKDDPLMVTYRGYLDTKRSAPAFDPLKLYVARVNATRLVVEIEASMEVLPNITAGVRYTIDRYPPLAYV
jgi:hypothetical protein